jgi:hypothetical protein
MVDVKAAYARFYKALLESRNLDDEGAARVPLRMQQPDEFSSPLAAPRRRVTVALILTGLAAAFLIGFLLGDRRGVRQCNSILEQNWRELMTTIRDEPLARPNLDRDGDKEVSPTVH